MNQSMKYKIIIFDLDGVLFDTLEIARLQLSETYPDFTKEIQKELSIGNFHEELKKFTLLKKEETEEGKIQRRLSYAKKKSLALMFPGAKELLQELHGMGYILVLNTSAYDRNCKPLLERTNIISLFDFLATADISKSKVDKFKIIEEKYVVQSKELIFITDTLGDIREADLANVPTLAVTWGAHDREYFAREKHTNLIGIVDSFDKLRAFITQRGE